MLLVYLCTLFSLVVADKQFLCFSDGSYLYKQFGIATSYQDTVNHKQFGFSIDTAPVILQLRKSKDAKLYDVRDEILDNFDKHQRGELCKSDLKLFRTWDFSINASHAISLTETGKNDLIGLGERLKENFPAIFEKYSPEKIEIRLSSQANGKESAQALTEGIWDKPLEIPDSWKKDSLLKNEENCSTWKTYSENPKGIEQVALFKKGPEMQQVLRKVSERLGFEKILDYDVVRDMYDLCSYEHDWYPKKISPWCIAFSERDLLVFEYLGDLKTFYNSGYLNPAMPKLGCELVGDLFTRIATNKPKATIYIGSSLNNRKVMTSLGIGDSGPLDAKGFHIYADRKWRMTFLCPKSATIAAVNYKCKKGSYGIAEESRIAIFINERNNPRLFTAQGKAMRGLNEFHNYYQVLFMPDYCSRDFCENSNQ